jgi:hypothetical protein
MVLKIAEIIFNDSSSKFNKDLTDFLKRNLEPIILKAQIKFKFTIAQKGELESLRRQGIKRLPAMIMDDKPIIGVPEIIETLRHNVKKSKSTAAPKSAEEILAEYQREALGDIPTNADGKILIKSADELDQEPGNNMDNELHSSAQEFSDKRKKITDMRNKKGADREPPAKTDRKALNDNDIRNRKPSITNNTRPDNLSMDDDMFTASAMSAMRSKGDDSKDMDMVAQMLAKIGGDD